MELLELEKDVVSAIVAAKFPGDLAGQLIDISVDGRKVPFPAGQKVTGKKLVARATSIAYQAGLTITVFGFKRDSLPTFDQFLKHSNGKEQPIPTTKFTSLLLEGKDVVELNLEAHHLYDIFLVSASLRKHLGGSRLYRTSRGMIEHSLTLEEVVYFALLQAGGSSQDIINKCSAAGPGDNLLASLALGGRKIKISLDTSSVTAETLINSNGIPVPLFG